MGAASRAGLSRSLDRVADLQYRYVDAECRRRVADDFSHALACRGCACTGGNEPAGFSGWITCRSAG